VGEALDPYPTRVSSPGPLSVDFDCHIQLNPTLKATRQDLADRLSSLSSHRCNDGDMSRNLELGILVAVAGATAISFAVFGVDTLGIIILSICVVCLGLLVARPDED
jgi:hypothetical protein